jgi:tripartite-type tricarboxylate transporter receptor subunit TctC
MINIPPANQRRRQLAAALGAALGSPWFAAHAQAYPARPVRIVHGFDSGSNPDVVARIIGPALTERLGQAIIVDAKPGAGGRIATAHVATQEPDGYTLMMLTAGDSVIAATDSKLSYDLLRDFAFISSAIQFPFVILVGAGSPFRSLRDLIDAAKRAPGKLSFGTPGIRTTQHFCGELLKSTADIDLLHVPFKGSPLQDLIGGRLDLMIAAPSVSTPQIQGGKVRALAVTGPGRMETLPAVPAVAETLPGFEVTSWLGLAAPAKTSPAIVERLSAEVRQVLGRPAVRERLLAIGSEPGGSTGAALRARVAADIGKWKGLAGKARLDA